MPDKVDEGNDSWDFEAMVPAKKGAMLGIFGMLQEVQRDWENGDDAVTTKIVAFIEPARETIEKKHRNVKLFKQTTDTDIKFVEARAAGSTMRG